jgi:sugar phosphate isomerase/epimerase
MYRNLSTQGLGVSGVESEIIELALTYKFKSIDPDFEELCHRADERGAKYALRLIESGGVKLGPFRLPVAWQEEDSFQKAVQTLPKLAARAAELGCTRATVAIEPGCDQRPFHENFEFHRRRLGELGQILAPHQLKLGLELRAAAELRQGHAFEFVKSFSELRKLAEGVNLPNVGVVLDVFNWYMGGGTMEDFAGLPADRIVAVLLADAPADVPRDQLSERHRLLPNDTGVIDSSAIVNLLVALNYDGPVTAKPDRSRFPKTGRLQIVRMIAESLNQVWIAAGLPPVPPPPPPPPPTPVGASSSDSAE